MGKVQSVERWWNGTWGRLARVDVWLRTDGQRWDVWVREGGAEGKSHHREYDTEVEAREALAAIKDPRWSWRQIRTSSRA